MNHDLLNFNHIRLINNSNPHTSSIIESFAVDDTLCLSVSETGETAMRFWVHQPTVVLGIPDSRLPHLSQGVQYLKQQGYDVIIRNSGGLAVTLDEGILNISLIFPDAKSFDIHDGYEAMVKLIQWLFEDEGQTIEAYEIEQSYCPGTYDLSIDGKKFAGISQRRVKSGSAVQIYLCVEGDGEKRAQLLQHFYQLSLKGETTKFKYPHIDPTVMASLEQLLGKKITIKQVMEKLINKFKDYGVHVLTHDLNEREHVWLQSRLQLMNKRNEHL
ncbi:lipoate--protein ligase family protein [Alkalibacillus aidingensis]|uniref:lipoate--protein ligase family protein n=1 Tax=Alkalibacillus aidingensis TaxID=2747607 RepID=UPI001660C433|nr:lipoate--protein ligase family protein [Alkalibacillus aidingensis]